MLKTPMQLLLGARGKSYTPQGGLADRQWGQQNIDEARFDESAERIKNMGKPGHHGLGFKTSRYGTPNTTWDGFHGLMMGLRDGANAQGRTFKLDPADYMNDSRVNTRFDDEQIGVSTGSTLADDQAGFQAAINTMRTPSRNIIANLRKRFGL